MSTEFDNEKIDSPTADELFQQTAAEDFRRRVTQPLTPSLFEKTADDFKRNEAQTELDALDAETLELAERARLLRTKREAMTESLTRPRGDSRSLGLAARDAILNLLAHRTDDSGATRPEREAWLSIAAFLEASGN